VQEIDDPGAKAFQGLYMAHTQHPLSMSSAAVYVRKLDNIPADVVESELELWLDPFRGPTPAILLASCLSRIDRNKTYAAPNECKFDYCYSGMCEVLTGGDMSGCIKDIFDKPNRCWVQATPIRPKGHDYIHFMVVPCPYCEAGKRAGDKWDAEALAWVQTMIITTSWRKAAAWVQIHINGHEAPKEDDTAIDADSGLTSVGGVIAGLFDGF